MKTTPVNEVSKEKYAENVGGTTYLRRIALENATNIAPGC